MEGGGGSGFCRGSGRGKGRVGGRVCGNACPVHGVGVLLSIGSRRTLCTGLIAMRTGVDTRVHNASFCHRHNFQWNVCLFFVSIQRRPPPLYPPSLNTPSSLLKLRLDPSPIFVIECRRFLTERARHERGGCPENCAPSPAIARDHWHTVSIGN